MSKKLTKDFTRGSIARHLIEYSVPYVFANLLQACYSSVDTIVVGQAIGSAGTAAIGIGGQVMMIITTACTGLCQGGTITLAQHKGRGERLGETQAIGTFFSTLLIVAVSLALLGVLLSSRIVGWLNTPEEAVTQAVSYLRISCVGIVFIFGYNAVCAMFRGLGNSKYPLYFVAIATVVNVILDIVFVVYMGMESAGAALATIIAQSISFSLAVIVIARQENFPFRFRLSEFRIYRDKLWMILKLGVPNMLQSFAVQSSFTLAGSMINSYGVAAAAANSIGNRISSFFSLPRQAIAHAVASIVGQNMGAEKVDRAEKAVKLGVVFCLGATGVVYALVNIFPAAVTSIFDNTPEVIEETTRYIHIVTISFLLMSAMTVYNNFMLAVGNSARSMTCSVVEALVIRLPLCWLLKNVFDMGLIGVYIGLAVAPALTLVLGWQYFHFGNWRERRLLKSVK